MDPAVVDAFVLLGDQRNQQVISDEARSLSSLSWALRSESEQRGRVAAARTTDCVDSRSFRCRARIGLRDPPKPRRHENLRAFSSYWPSARAQEAASRFEARIRLSATSF